MTLKITTEQLGQYTAEGFAQMVQGRIDVLREYDAHEAVVRRHAADPDMAPEDRWVSLAVPQEPSIDAAIRTTANADGTHTFEADYEIVPPSLEKRKAVLFDQVSVAEREAINGLLPAGRIRAYQFREADIRKADQARWADAVKDATPESGMDYAKFTDEHRPITDTRFLEEQAARADQSNEIQRWAANLHSDIEDLTAETVDAWEVKPFHG